MDHAMTGKIIKTVTKDNNEMKLVQRGNHFEIISNGVFLMATYGGESEQKMAEDGLFYLSEIKTSDINVLIGGLGMGYSLIPTVNDERVSKIDVVELEPDIIDWNYKYFKTHNRGVVESDTVHVVQNDVYSYLHRMAGKESQPKYDLIILDVDNGPDWLVKPDNNRLYQQEGLDLIRKGLNFGGCAAIWSLEENENLENNLLANFSHVFIKYYKITDQKGRQHHDCVYFGQLD